MFFNTPSSLQLAARQFHFTLICKLLESIFGFKEQTAIVQIIIIEHFTFIELLSNPKKSYIFIAEYRQEML